jgi:cyclic beta-1,2-glucan synthetase
MRRILKKSHDIKEKRLLEKEIGVLSKSCKGFRLNLCKSLPAQSAVPALGQAIAALDEINEETVRECISFIASQKELTSMDVDSFCWQAKFAVIESAVIGGASDSDYGAKLGALTLLDTEKICRELNPLDRVYGEDELYSSLTGDTRALYRKMTAEICSATKESESRLSRELVNCASKSGVHVGEIILRIYRKAFPLMRPASYIALLFACTAVLTVLISLAVNRWLALLVFFPAFAVVKPILDLAVSKSVKETVPLPQIDLKGEIPAEARTLCVISTLLTSVKDVEQVVRKLDVARHKNTSANLFFCALCDFKGNKGKSVAPGDNEIIEEVKRKFTQSGYIALIRKREFSKTQRCFQGRERKRGAIESLMKLLRSADYPQVSDDFREITGNVAALADIKYVCALDYDTVPLMDSISELVGIAEHPSHRDIGIIAPRITTSLASSLKTGFTRAMVGNGGCAGASSYDSFSGEFYQDCFGEGIFTGKGLINVNLFIKNCFDRFPDEAVLSHDILEGGFCGVAYAGDVEFADSFPETGNAYFKRQHRWLRGDLQNFAYMFDERFSRLTRFKLFDNVRRAITPILLFLCFFAMLLPNVRNSALLGTFALLAVIMPFLTGFLPSVIRGRKFSNYRRFYSPVISQTKQLLRQCIMEVLLLPKNALVSGDAVCRTVWRMLVSKRHLLDWTTAEMAGLYSPSGTVASVMHMPGTAAVSGGLFVLSVIYGNAFTAVTAVFFMSSLPVIMYCDKSGGESKPRIPEAVKRDLIDNSAQIWQFYEDYVTEEHSFLPPDNVQYSPVYRVTFRTSPTNIGMYLMSCVAAKLLGFIDKDGFEERVSRTMRTIERMDKWNGNLCNWYTTDKLEVVSPFVSSVDSGNYVCCLVVLSEALKSFECQPKLIEVVDIQIAQTDLTPFYNEARNLFSIGYDMAEEKLSHHHYDLLMSEARMLSYYAIASGQANKRHWRHLGRVMGKRGRYAAPVAWTGTMFEYFMPELVLSSKEGSMEYEALRFCLHCQEAHGRGKDLPFGVSESGFYAFDRSLNYQYKAHGVQDIGLKAGLDREYVVSPYSSFLALAYDPIGCYNNLAKLEKLGMCHEKYGFYEAADFTKHRVGSGYAVVKSHMAHHMGMSICAVANTLFDGIIQKLFISNEKMKRAEELMEEKIIAGEPVLGPPQRQDEKEMRMNADILTSFSVTAPRLNVLSNGRLSVITSDTGLSQTFFDGKAALFPTADVYKPRGSAYAFVENDCVYPFFNYGKSKESEQCVVFTQNTTEYLSHAKTLRMRQDVFLDETRPVEIRQFSAVNKSSVKRNLTLACYLEPALARTRDISAHPAFMDLFLKLEYNEEERLFIASRKERDGNAETVMAIGFAEPQDFTFSFNREEVIARNGGIFSCLEKARDRSSSTTDVPCPCLFIKADCMLEAHGKRTANLFTCYGESAEEAVRLARAIRSAHKLEPSEEIISPLVANTIYGRITRRVLGSILYTPQINKSAVLMNSLDVKTLWKYGISGDVPIVLYEPGAEPVSAKSAAATASRPDKLNGVDSVIEMKKALSLCQVEFDLVMLYETVKQRQLYEELRGEINTEVFIIDKNAIDRQDLHLIRASAVLTLYSGSMLSSVKPSRVESEPILPLNKSGKMKSEVKHGFDGDRFVIDESPDVPWCNVLANSRFGSLVSDRSLGFSWALNSRENKLTPWINDLRADNRGELLVMKSGNKLYDLIDGSRAVFAPNAADYCGIAAREIESSTSVRVYERGMGKRVVVELYNHGKTAKTVEVAYYTEPVMGVEKQSLTSRLIKPEVADNSLIMRNPANGALSGAMVISGDKRSRFLTDKAAFWAGKWSDDIIEPHSDMIGAVIIKIDLPPKRREKIKFILSFTQNSDEPLSMEKALKRRKSTVVFPTREIDSGCGELDALYKHWLPWQVIGCRMWARTGFYQNSGAYGFRDQLQDCLAAVKIRPLVAKTQILRCCTAQFEEGDVLHWWHDLLTARKGVRTRYSDDLLWLPFVTADYVKQTGDKSILSVKTRYCTGELLQPHEHEVYSEVGYSPLKESVYEHCKRALEKACNKSERGLLRIGGGDWCDGYNRVGAGGTGESVWLCMFYACTAKEFSKTAMLAGDLAYAVELESRAAELIKATDEHCWDGEHYLRAFYDDGTAMGGGGSQMCRIDLLPQAFSVLADMPDSDRVQSAVNSALRELYDSENRIVKLFTPPFERAVSGGVPDPGYVQSYPAGVRENGGQYSHSVNWLISACHRLGMESKTHELIQALSPINRNANYKTEPYYLAADIYTNPKAYGRGGWSIYTGAAGWFYRVLREVYGE